MVSLTGTNTRQPLQWALAGGHEAKHRPGNEKWWKMTCTWDELGIDSLRYYIYIIIVIICQWLYNSILNPGDPSQYETPSKNRQKPAFWDHLGATKIRGMGLLWLDQPKWCNHKCWGKSGYTVYWGYHGLEALVEYWGPCGSTLIYMT